MIQKMFATVDIKKTNYKNVGKINHGDDLLLEIRVLSDGDMLSFNNPMVDLLVKKSDGKMVRQTSGIELIKPNIFVIEVSKDCVTSPGLTTNQLIINDDGRVSTCMFYYTVLNSLEEDVMPSISNVEVLEQLDEFVVQIQDKMEVFDSDLVERIDELTDGIVELEKNFNDTSSTLNEAEVKRSEAEQLRAQAEALRVQNEDKRAESENVRVQNESDRAAAELIREQREVERVLNDEERHQNESERAMDEELRQQNESVRQSNESVRISNENDRKAQENRRVTAETNRVNAETTRRNNENSRISNETERQKAMNEMKSLLEDAREFDERVGVIEDEIEEINSSLDTLTNDFYNEKIIDLKNEKDFNVNDISMCINRIFSNIENYTTVKLSIDTCYLTNPITITMREGCELILNCKIICKNDINAINVDGNRVSNNIYIRTLISSNNLNFNTVVGNGITLNNYYNSSIRIGEVLGFNTGLLLKGTLGTQYNKVDFFSISNCKESIKLLTTYETEWVNENTFYGGRLGGNIAINLSGLSGKDVMNNNKFYNVGFEGVNELLIKSTGAKYNSFFNPRVLEDFPKLKWVDEDGTCRCNKYYFTFPVDVNMFKLDYLGQIIGTITNGTKTISQTGAICDWDIKSQKMVMQYNYWLNGILMTDEDFNSGGGRITLSECFKEVYCKLSTSARILRIDKHLLYNGFTFNLYITSATNGSLKLEYYRKNGELKTGTNFLTNGVYKVTMYNDLLVYTKIGEEFQMV